MNFSPQQQQQQFSHNNNNTNNNNNTYNNSNNTNMMANMGDKVLQTHSLQPPQINLDVDKKRIDVLLQINTILLHKCIIFQSFIMNKSNINLPDYLQKKEIYQNYLKRIHFNLACLASINDIHSAPPNTPKKNYTIPQIVLPPRELPELSYHYKVLNQLYPEAIPIYQKRMEVQRLQQQQQQQPTPQQFSQIQQQQPQPGQQFKQPSRSASGSAPVSAPNVQQMNWNSPTLQNGQVPPQLQQQQQNSQPGQPNGLLQQQKQQLQQVQGQQQQQQRQQVPQVQGQATATQRQKQQQQQLYSQFIQQQLNQQQILQQIQQQSPIPAVIPQQIQRTPQQQFNQLNNNNNNDGSSNVTPLQNSSSPPSNYGSFNQGYNQQQQQQLSNSATPQQFMTSNGGAGVGNGNTDVPMLSPEQILARAAGGNPATTGGVGGDPLGNAGLMDGW